MIAGAFYESTALNVVSELGIADLIGKESVAISELAKEVNVDESRLREFVMSCVGLVMSSHRLRTRYEDACEPTSFP